MRILGIDPGTRLTGYGCLDLAAGAIEPTVVEAGVIRLDARQSLDARLGMLHEELTGLLAQLGPQRLAIEKLYAHYRHPRTAILMAHARGVIILAAERAGLAINHLPSTEVKKSLTGHGHASKEQMQGAIATRCGLAAPPEPADVADALAIAYCDATRLAYERLG